MIKMDLRTKLRGVIAPICTAFSNDEELALDALRHNIGKYNASPLTGFVVAGSTGEAGLLDAAERATLFAAVREAADEKVLIAGTGTESVRETVRLIATAADLGYDAALVLTPHYYKAQMQRPESQIAFFRAVADSAPIPVLIYNFPQMTGVDLALNAIQQLAE